MLVAIARLTFGISAVRDIPVDDEALYASAGIRMLNALHGGAWQPPPPDWAPLHSAYYAALHAFFPARDQLFDVAWVLLITYVTGAMYAVARAMSCPPLLSLVAAGAVLATNLFHVLPFPSHVLAGLLLTAVLVATRCRTFLARLAVLTAALFAGAFLRPEMAALAIAAMGAYVVLMVRQRRSWRQAIPLVAQVAVLATMFGSPLGRGRAFIAFSQHYAFGVARREHLADDAWMNHPRITARDFGDATTLTSAFLRNPKAVASHVFHNVVELPSNVLDLCSLRANVTEAPPPWLQGVSAILIGLAVVVLLGTWLRSRSHAAPTVRFVRLTFLAVCAAVTPGLLFIFPRAHYFVVPCLFGWLLAMHGLARLADRVVGRASPVGWAIVIAGLLGIVPASSDAAASSLPQRRAVAALRHLALHPGVTMDLTGGVVLYAGYDSPRISEWVKDQRWNQFVIDRKIDTVFVWERFLAHQSFADDNEFTEFLAAPASLDFCEVYVDPGYGRLLVRPHVLREEDRRHLCVPSRGGTGDGVVRAPLPVIPRFPEATAPPPRPMQYAY